MSSSLDRLQAIKEAGDEIADRSAIISKETQQLQSDVAQMNERLNALELDSKVVAHDLVDSQKKVAAEQEVQDDRLTTLEP